jgi:hypothetical protein
MLGVLLLLTLFGIVALLLGFSRWLARRPWAAAGNVAIALVLFTFVRVGAPAAQHLRTYEPMPANGIVAQVHCERTAPRTYRVTLTQLPAGRMQVYELAGDAWRIDARTLVWKSRAARLGLSPGFRWERLTARDTRAGSPSADGDAADADAARGPEGYGLSDPDEVGEDVWSQARTGQRWAGDVEPGRAYGPWRPLADGARFDVWLTHAPGTFDAQLDAKPANEAGARAMGYTQPHNDKVRATRG